MGILSSNRNKLLLVFVILVMISGFIWVTSSDETTRLQNPLENSKTNSNLNVDQLLVLKPEQLSQKVTTSGNVLVESICPPSMPGGSGICTTSFYLVAKHESYLPSVTKKLLLYEDGHLVGCAEPVPATGCNGWMDNQIYQITGTLEYLQAGGKQTNTPILNVSSKQKI